MKGKILGILICTLLMTVTVLSEPSDTNVSKNIYEEGCGCYQGNGINLTVGICDNFVLPTEPTFPSQTLWDWVDINYQGTNDTRECDETGNDKFWVHTFNLTGICNESYIVGAILTITVLNNDTGPNNDNLILGCIDDIYDSWDIGGNLTYTYGIPVGQSGTIVIDLTDYPSFFNDILQHEYLDVGVQDDSYVDCAILTIYCCECQLEVGIKSGFYFRTGTIPVIIKNVGSTVCDNISYNITIKSIFGKVSGSSIGYTTLLPGEETTVNCQVIGKFGIFKIIVEVEACGHIYTDTAFGIVFGPFIFVF